MNLFSFGKRIKRPLILDGAMGSMLQSFNLRAKGSLWMSYLNIDSPDKVLKIHKKYIDAGADIITTNTFRTNPSALKGFPEIRQDKFVKESVKLALEARGKLPVLIAGSNAPAEDCYQVERKLTRKELAYNHHKHIDLLMSSGCDFVLNETQSHLDEIEIILRYCSKKSIPFVISFFFNNNLRLLSGERLFDILNSAIDHEPLAVGFNCIMPETFLNILSKIRNHYNWGFYLNCGSGSYTDEIIKCSIEPEEYIKFIRASLSKKPSFVGSCCGSSPAHIKEIKRLLDG